MLKQFSHGTHIAVHKVSPYMDTIYDKKCVTNAHDKNQKLISPDGMQWYGNIDLDWRMISGPFKHKDISVGNEQDFGDDCVKNYI